MPDDRGEPCRGALPKVAPRQLGQVREPTVHPYWQLEEGQLGTEREIAFPDTLGVSFALADSVEALGAITA